MCWKFRRRDVVDMLRLMIVDDEQIIREALAEMIDYESLGYSLIAAARNGMEAYDIICDEYPDVVITDIKMPVLDGLALIERATKSDSNITFILLSGYNEFEYAKQAMRYGVRYYLLKPTDKNELMEALKDIRLERQQEEKRKIEEQERLLRKMQMPLEECFIKEALDFGEDFGSIFRKYQPLLSIPETGLAACVCSFVEEGYLKKFAADVYSYLGKNHIKTWFPLIYVKNNAVLTMEIPGLAVCEALKGFVEQISYPEQSVGFEANMMLGEGLQLFEKIIGKISRFEQIVLINETGERKTIYNNIASPTRIDQLGNELILAGREHVSEILKAVFEIQMSVEKARNIALSLFLKWNPVQGEQPVDIACDFFRKLYNCADVESVRELVHRAVQKEEGDASSKRPNSNIPLVKAYVERHYSDEYLSLKWIAENYLFVSVGYLSKQFVKEEGIRFSEYLNQVRMEEAKRLMHYYHNENITDIACQVGFGNNPQYFRQVFKRYTGYTPSVYVKNREV